MHPEATTAQSPATGTAARDRALLMAIVVAFAAAGGWLFRTGIGGLLDAWSREEYSHGPVIPLIALYLILRRLPEVSARPTAGRWIAPALGLVAMAFGVVGALSEITDVSQWGLLLAVVALLVGLLGTRRTTALWAPIVYLGFMVPLPNIVYLELFAWAQLVASNFGTALVRLAGVPVFLDGNIIDLGPYKLQITEACSGLRYLFPLMSFGYLFAVLFDGKAWERALLFLSTIPIAILMNSLRIGVIGILVDGFGIAQAEGFLHASEGWIIFIACIAILFAIASVLTYVRFGRSAVSSLDFGFERLAGGVAVLSSLRDWRPLLATAAVFAVGIGALQALEDPPNRASARESFATFPTAVGDWQGSQIRLDPAIERVLGANDYILANYAATAKRGPVNLYVAYFARQTKGSAVHSPEVCIPGSGWEITQFERARVPFGGAETRPVNRVVIQKGTTRQLVYYWFQERDRHVTSEYAAKWFILWDSILRNRSDGALVRLITPIDGAAGGAASADDRLQRFIETARPVLKDYLPG